MDHLLAARSQMAMSLAFHIVFASVGMTMPFFMAVAHARYLKTKDPADLALTRMWSKGVAIFFATGAVSGTVLSFELGLLWPKFMELAGPIIGMPFSWEGAAFFLEAIALGLFLYGWNRLPPRLHWFSGLAVGICGIASGLFVLTANSWMNHPAGFDWVNGQAINIRPFEAMFHPGWLTTGTHMILAAFEAVGFAVAGVHAYQLLRGRAPKLHSRALAIALSFGSIAAMLQPISGDLTAKLTARMQPEKLAAMELLKTTQAYAPLTLGGWIDKETHEIHGAIEIPGALSFLSFGKFSARVTGMDEFPASERPPANIVHFAFQIMMGLGSLLALLGIYSLWRIKKQKVLEWPRPFLKILVGCTPLGFIALEAGWTVTEVGRQPWIIYRILRTSDAVTPHPGMELRFATFTLLYLFLIWVVVWLMNRQIRSAAHHEISEIAKDSPKS